VARIFNTYGPRMHPHDGRVVSNFIMQALKDEDITIFGDGQQTRSFCYCSDLVEAFLRLMASPDEITGPINTGNPGEFSMLEQAPNQKLSISPCPRTTPNNASPTSLWPKSTWAGSQKCPCAKASCQPSNISRGW